MSEKTKVKLADLAREYGIDYYVLHSRLYRLNWPLEKALTTPVSEKREIEVDLNALPKPQTV